MVLLRLTGMGDAETGGSSVLGGLMLSRLQQDMIHQDMREASSWSSWGWPG